MQGRIVVIDTGFVAITAVQDLLEVLLGSGQSARLLRAKVMQSSDADSTQAELLRINIKRATGTYTSGSGGSSATVVKGMSGDPAHGLAGTERNNTTQAAAGTGTLDTLEAGVFNVLAGEWEYTATPELAFPIGPSEAVVLSLDTAPADSIDVRAIIDLLIVNG